MCHHRRTGNGNESGLMIIMPSRAASEDLFCFSGGGRGLFLKEKRHNFREIDFTKKGHLRSSTYVDKRFAVFCCIAKSKNFIQLNL